MFDQLLDEIKSDESARNAFNELARVISSDMGITKEISAENKFILAAAKVFGENETETITGKEKKAHYTLGRILVAHRDEGKQGLIKLGAELS